MSYRYHTLWLGIGLGMTALVIFLSLMSEPPQVNVENFDKLGHLLAYGVLMGWFAQLYPGFYRRLGIALALICLGISLEYLQGLSGSRMFEYADMLANTSGVLLGWGLSHGPLARILRRLDNWLRTLSRNAIG